MIARLFATFALSIACLVSCQTLQKPEAPVEKPTIPTIIDADAGKKTAKEMMWPFTFAGFLGIIGGLGYAVLFKNLKLLSLGIGIALVPPTFFFFFEPILPYVAIMALIAGAMLLAMLGWKVYDTFHDGIVENRRDKHGD